ncbi:MAG: hypothetical protein WBA11_17765, partial [Rubrivirga sp.]
ATAQTGALMESMFDAYRPSVRVPGACPHPTRLVESAATQPVVGACTRHRVPTARRCPSIS